MLDSCMTNNDFFKGLIKWEKPGCESVRAHGSKRPVPGNCTGHTDGFISGSIIAVVVFTACR